MGYFSLFKATTCSNHHRKLSQAYIHFSLLYSPKGETEWCHTYFPTILSSFPHFIFRKVFCNATTVAPSFCPHSTSIACVAFPLTRAKVLICVLLNLRCPPSCFHLSPGFKWNERSLIRVYGTSRSIFPWPETKNEQKLVLLP